MRAGGPPARPPHLEGPQGRVVAVPATDGAEPGPWGPSGQYPGWGPSARPACPERLPVPGTVLGAEGTEQLGSLCVRRAG